MVVITELAVSRFIYWDSSAGFEFIRENASGDT